ncbi:acidic phospholipase A2 D-like [Daphnia pulex]|uniref:acidic phospholipase A2 D-like n=1 Tax=Daphnia pulex TaxID=6669 RepID=UPI001EE05B72|nr:acidic phospholipase A2 D-like [Daphnia pulex]
MCPWDRSPCCWRILLAQITFVTVAMCQQSMDTSQYVMSSSSASAMNESSSNWMGVRGERSTGSDEVMTSMALVQSRRKSDSTSGSGSGRTKRDIFHLYNMMSCTTQCDPLSYKGYGCYCGFLGSGLTVDAIDRCCKKHDFCYGATPCRHQSLIYFVPYKWKCNGGHPYCVTGYGQMKAGDICAHHLCECDRQFAECIRHYPCPAKKTTCPSNPLRSLG